MFLPLSDNNPLKIIGFQYVTVTLVVLNAAIFLYSGHDSGAAFERDAPFGYGMIPAALFGARELVPSLARIPEELTLVSYQFFHGGWLHLISNMAFLWVFGDNVEDSMGHWRFGIFYVVCGALAGLAHAVADPSSSAPLIGASGSVAGVLAAYMILHPRQRIWVLFFLRIPVRLPALWAIAAWMGFQFLNLAAGGNGANESVAWWAHVGGFAAGIPLLYLLTPDSSHTIRRSRERDAERLE